MSKKKRNKNHSKNNGIQKSITSSSVQEAIESAGVESTVFNIPLIEGDSTLVYVPYHFFSGDFFSNLHQLDDHHELIALNPNRLDVMKIQSQIPSYRTKLPAKDPSSDSLKPGTHRREVALYALENWQT